MKLVLSNRDTGGAANPKRWREAVGAPWLLVPVVELEEHNLQDSHLEIVIV